MSDIFHEEVYFSLIDKIFDAIRQTNTLTLSSNIN